MRDKPVFYTGGSVLEYVASGPHLRHIIANAIYDSLEVQNWFKSLSVQLNDALCRFKGIKIMLHN